MLGEGNKGGIEGMEGAVSREEIIKAEAMVALSGNELHSEANGNNSQGKKAEVRKGRTESLDDFKAKIEIALSVNPESRKDRDAFSQNAATVLAIESAKRSEAKM